MSTEYTSLSCPSLLSVSLFLSHSHWLCSSLITEEEIQSSNLFFSPFPFVLIDVETRDIFLFSDQTCFIFGLGRLLSPRANHSFRLFSLFSWRGFGIPSLGFHLPSQKTRKIRYESVSIVASEAVEKLHHFFRLASFDYWLIRDLCCDSWWLDLSRSFKKGKIFS